MVLPLNVTFKCHKSSVEGEKTKSKINLLVSTVLLQNLVTMEKLSLQTCRPMRTLRIFISVKNMGCGCPDTALLCSSERKRNSWLLLCKAKYQQHRGLESCNQCGVLSQGRAFLQLGFHDLAFLL